MKINWEYFFGTRGDRYYKSIINGQRVEKHESNRGVKYAVGNIDIAKKKFKTEQELLDSLS